jgi:natural product biosynthesis luciferase-like monooxygenase protein
MSYLPDSVSNLVELLRYRAGTKAGVEAYTWLSGERPATNLSYEELDLRARTIAVLLKSAGVAKSPVVLAFPAGLDFIAAFFGCLYSGAIAVPVYPPGASRGLTRVASTAGDCGARFGLTTAPLAKRFAKSDALSAIRWFTEEDMKNETAQQWEESRISPETLAFLQYTSGSTGDPKGVMVTHGNILANERAIQKSFGQDESSVIVSWLPMGHDMGLIGGVLQPLYSGARCILFSPATFVQEPASWLRAISTHRATTSGGPDFAYRLCARKLGPEHKAGLDLSCWRVAFNGAEQVQRDTLNEFSESFRDCGFRREAFHPCYGLAESTLLVSCNTRGSLGKNSVSRFVSCGPVIEQHSLRIVDPKTGLGCSDGETGEILISGPSVAQGYWGRPEESDATFRAQVADSDGGLFLRTGDLGFLDHDELVVSGRLKDLIILRGQNYYPQDIEISSERSCRELQAGSCAAFANDEAGEQQIIVVQEVPARSSSYESTLSAVRRAVSIEHEVRLDAVVLVPLGAIPKTSSGKVRRHRCRELLENGEIEIIALWRSRRTTESDDSSAPWFTDFDNAESVCEWITNQLAVLTGTDARLIDPDTEIASYGIDSLTAAELTSQLEKHRVELDFTALFGQITIRKLSLFIADSTKSRGGGQETDSTANNDGEFPLSRGQYALWLNQQLDVTASVYNLAFAARTRSEVSASAMRAACKAVVARHSILRATFPVVEGQPRHHVIECPADSFAHIDARGWGPDEVERHAAMAAYQPFDLVNGPLLRVIFYESEPGSSVILVAVHHIVSDFSSLALLVREIFAHCGGAAEAPEFSVAPFSEYVRREEQVLSSDTENRLWEFWRRELTHAPPPLELPVTYPAMTNPAREAGWESTHIGLSTVAALRRLSAERSTTLHTTLVGTFEVLLHRYSGQSDFAIGLPVSLRDGGEFRQTQGYFINPVILRAAFDGDPTFTEFLDQTRQRILRAFNHRHFPFGTLVGRLQPVRTPGRPPVVQAIFTFLSETGPVSDSALFGLGLSGAKLTVGAFELESLGLQPVSTEFDLTLMVAEATDGLHAVLGYRRDLFSQEMAAAMLRSWRLLIDGIVASPSSRVSALPILSAEEMRLGVVEFNDTTVPFDESTCIHQAFERKAIRMPNVIAVSGEGKSLTYAELNDRADRLASYLRAAGVRPDDVVGVCLRRSPDLLVGLLGILKSGGAYLPLDPDYPPDRIAFILGDSGAQIVVAHEALTAALIGYQGTVVSIDRGWAQINQCSVCGPTAVAQPENLAYVIYTSGSTGVPKGVMIAHRNVANFFAGMDRIIGSAKHDAWLAVTSICFDISVLELLWTVTRGVRVLLDSGLGAVTAVNPRNIAFSLFYFASDAAVVSDARYRLLLEGAKFADENGFEAVWTPERHFHTFGGSYPNPALLGAALAAITKHIHIRAGSVVLPLHHPVRVAEDWSVVDNLSKGRAGVSFASGWHAEDFVLAPASYTARREIMYRDIETVRRLWRGESVQFQSGNGHEVAVRIYPAPIQSELPVWVTAAGTEETFRMAGEIGANLLTHLLGQSLPEVAHNVSLYRAAWRNAGHPGEGKVTLMLHTFVGHDTDSVRETVREPMIAYLKDSVSLIKSFARSTGEEMPEDLDGPDMKTLLAVAFDRYFESSGLFGTPERCLKTLEHLKAAQIDEVACLIDFGVETSSVLESLRLLAEVKRRTETRLEGVECRPSHLQCTPSLARMLFDREDVLSALSCLLVGGEALPAADAERLTKCVAGSVHNMYGPTETCVWSTSDLLDREAVQVTLGRPLANTQVYVTGRYGEAVPIGVSGEICIGGEGVARGYLRRPDLTAERFVPDPFSEVPGARMYRTGDRGMLNHQYRLQFLGRFDDQVKLRGHRIELGEIEDAVSHHPAVREAAAMVQSSGGLNSQLLCYVVARNAHRPSADELRGFLAKKLPEYMLPAGFIWLEEMPRTPNGKLDRMVLASADGVRACSNQFPKQPQDAVEEVLAEIWSELLAADSISVDRNFFDLGGHSLLAVRLIGMVREVFQVNVELGVFFKNPTITALAQEIRMIAGERAQHCAELFKAVEHLPDAQVEVMLGSLDQRLLQ